MFPENAEWYDALYAGVKDFDAEAAWIAERLRDLNPAAHDVLDAACGTGRHATALATTHGFAVDGFDLDPAMVRIAAARNPAGRFTVADLTDFVLDLEYDVILCMFSSIGYVRTPQNLARTLRRFAEHTRPDGIVLVEPWFPPGVLQHGYVMTLTADAGDARVCRMSRTTVEGRLSRLVFEYLIGEPNGIRRAAEVHELGLFTREETLGAFQSAGFDAHHQPDGPTGRGLYVGRKPAAPRT